VAVLRSVTAVAVLALLAGCGGAGSSGSGAVPKAASSSQTAKAAISLTIPLSGTSATRRGTAAPRGRETIPAATQSIVLTFSGLYGAALTPAVPPVTIDASTCSTVSSGLQCSTSVTLPYGSVVASIAAYAGANGTGTLLAAGTGTITVASGVSASFTLSTTSTYTIISNDNIGTLAIDHAGQTFTVSNATSANTSFSGTFTQLGNGDLEATIANNADDSNVTVGDTILLRESANGAVMVEDSGTTSPTSPWTGDSTTGGGGFGIANAACATAQATIPFALASISGNSFVASGSSASQALITGSVDASPTTITGTANAYDINDNSLGAMSPGTLACQSNGVYEPSGSTTGGPLAIAFNLFGVVAALDGNNGGAQSVEANIGFANLTSASLSALEAGSFDGFLVNGNDSTQSIQPISATGSASGLSLCPYTDVLNDVPSSGANCVTATFTSQPLPGVILGTASGAEITGGGSVFVAVVGELNGKALIVGIGDNGTNTSPGQAGNFVLFQH
jgi:hypothetical protein